MKNLSTGTGLAILAGAALAYPFVSSLAPNANAVGIGTTAVSAVAAAATAQGAPTIVWYGTSQANWADGGFFFRAWSDGKVEIRSWYWPGGQNACGNPSTFCVQPWRVLNDPASGLTFDADLNFDEAVDGNDLGMMLAKWGPAPRNPVPPSDCPLGLIN
jgi:hypothetical protein